MSDDNDSVWSAVRAAAAVTGLFKRSAAIGALALAACGGPTATTSTTPENKTSVAAPVDAGIDGPACAHDPGWGSPCCEAIDNQSRACMAWGPPVPPAFVAEVVA